jgi:hypothetical protein
MLAREKTGRATAAAALVCLGSAASLQGCGCGFDCDRDDEDTSPAVLSLGVSDALPEELAAVVIEIDAVTLRRSGQESVVVDTFTIDDDGFALLDADSFQVDLLDYRGLRQLQVITDLELDPGSYDALELTLISGDINNSYVERLADDTRHPLEISGNRLELPGITLARGSQRYTIEFGLAHALRYRALDDSYRLTSAGIRVVDNDSAAGLIGEVDSALFDTVAPCRDKLEPSAGNRIYLYRGHDLPLESLADQFTLESEAQAPADAEPPYAVGALLETPLTGSWDYAFGYLPAGDYTLVFSCDSAADDPDEYDALTLPLPELQLYEVSLDAGATQRCDLSPLARDC